MAASLNLKSVDGVVVVVGGGAPPGSSSSSSRVRVPRARERLSFSRKGKLIPPGSGLVRADRKDRPASSFSSRRPRRRSPLTARDLAVARAGPRLASRREIRVRALLWLERGEARGKIVVSLPQYYRVACGRRRSIILSLINVTGRGGGGTRPRVMACVRVDL